MKKGFIPTLQPDPEGRPSGPAMRMLDFLKIQNFLIAGLAAYLKAVYSNTSPYPQVDYFEATLTAGLGVSVAPGIALDLEGQLYTSAADPVVVVMAAADPANPRIDVIVAVLEADVPAQLETRDYRELLSLAERTAVPPVVALEQPFEVPTELWMKATIVVRQGVAGDVPAAPALQAGDVPLWQVRVNAGVVALTLDKLTDVRNLISPFEVTPNTGLIKAGRHTIAGDPATAGHLGVIKVGAGLTIEPDGTLNNIFSNLEVLQDALAGSFNGVAPIAVAYNDPLNRWDFSIALASAIASGAMSAADFSKLAAATALNTTSTLMMRNGSGDVAVRDSIIERRISMPDTTYIYSAFPTEHQMTIMESEAGFTTSQGDFFGNPALVTRPGGGPAYYINLKIEEFQNVPMCIELVFKKSAGPSGCLVWLYDPAVGALVSGSGAGTTGVSAVLQARGSVFTLTGTGRKRYQLKAGVQYAGTNEQVILYAARLILHPAFSACGDGATPACPI